MINNDKYFNYEWIGARVALTVLLTAAPAMAASDQALDAAAAFGARPSVSGMRLSPDGKTVVYLAPIGPRGTGAYTLSIAPGARAKIAVTADGNPYRLTGCDWVSNERVVCEIYGITSSEFGYLSFTRMLAVDADGTNPRVLSHRQSVYARGIALRGGGIVDWMSDRDGVVLMSRERLADDRLSTRLGSTEQGTGVELVDTRTLGATTVEPPNPLAEWYVSDNHGAVRIMVTRSGRVAGQDSTVVDVLYRRKDSREWQALGTYDFNDRSGFLPRSVDRDLDVVYGFKKKNGRVALYSVALDGSMRETLLFAEDNVDVDRLIELGRQRRVVGASYVREFRSAHYFDATIENLTGALSRALPAHPPLRIVDSNRDETKLLIHSASDTDPGVYYLFDRLSHQLQTFLVVRAQLENVPLASQRPVSYPAADGTVVPGYLTLPPGKDDAKGLPAIVMPHGGPGARDEWGFDWLAQYFAARGYAVLQPNFRGSAGYGDAWFHTNGFRSWRIAIGDVLDAGRWLVSRGTADPSKLAIVGWSYGGYAALQSAVTDASVFKAVIAIAPVTDLDQLKEIHRRWSDFKIISDFVGDGPHVREGSPAQNAAGIKAPVLLFHGTMDRNVDYAQSVLMDRRLTAAHVEHELVTFAGLDHRLEDSEARADLLRKSDAFLRRALGL